MHRRLPLEVRNWKVLLELSLITNLVKNALDANLFHFLSIMKYRLTFLSTREKERPSTMNQPMNTRLINTAIDHGTMKEEIL